MIKVGIVGTGGIAEWHASAFKDNKNLFFKNLTFAPLEKDLIDENLLTKIEKDYIFSYHLETYSKLSAYLNNKERKWLAKLIQ